MALQIILIICCTLVIIGIFLFVIGEIKLGLLLATMGLLVLLIGYVVVWKVELYENTTPTALDVYRGKTTLVIIYREDSIAIDSMVVYDEVMVKKKKKGLYKLNKEAKIGETIECPICHTKFTKKQYSQAFCSTRCKDRFWNSKGDRHRYGNYPDNDFGDREMDEMFGVAECNVE